MYIIYHHMGVSKNNSTPKSSILLGCSIINHPFWGTIIFGNTHINIPPDPSDDPMAPRLGFPLLKTDTTHGGLSLLLVFEKHGKNVCHFLRGFHNWLVVEPPI